MERELCEAVISRLRLSDADRLSLQKDRGFDNDTIDKLKFVSTGPFIENDGWFSRNVPVEVYDALHSANVVIPYFDPEGHIIHFRPHHYGVKAESHHLYVPYPIMGSDFSRIVIAESEFKSVASNLMSVPAIGIPGISSFSKKNFQKLVDALKIFGTKTIAILFDNEVKDNPEFPNYKPDYTKRYDTEIYAYIMAQKLKKEGFEVGIAKLKDEWRVNGKADIDSVLAQGVPHEEYRAASMKTVSPAAYRERWSFPPTHLSYIERKIEKHFYGGPIEIKHSAYFSKSSEGSKKLSNFLIDVIHTMYDDSSRAERLCRFVSRYGNSSAVKIMPDAMSSKQSFQKFCYELGDYEWRGSENDLRDIWNYIFMCQDGKRVIKLSHYGYSKEWNSWFFDNGAYHDGKYYEADENGIVWIKDVGFMMMEDVKELSQPVLNPEGTAADPKLILEKMSAIFGISEAKTLLGWTIGNFFMPEIIAKWGVYPFLFLYGKQAGGKSTIANWVSSFFGFQQKGINFKGSSVVGLTRITSQMSMIPVWLEEYRSRDDHEIAKKNNFLRNVYDKTAVVKGTKRENEIKTYKARSTLIISGEETPLDAALLSRCILFPVYENDQKRKDNSHYEWMQENMSWFNAIGHTCLTKKQEIWPKIEARITEYLKSFGVQDMGISSRNKIHSSVIASVCDVIFGEDENFSVYVGDMAMEQEKRVKQDQALYVFFDDIYNYHMNDKFRQPLMKVVHSDTHTILSLAFNSLYAEWEILTKGIRQTLPAAKLALLEHMRREPYFLEAKSGRIGNRTHRIYNLNADHARFPPELSNLVTAIETDPKEMGFNHG